MCLHYRHLTVPSSELLTSDCPNYWCLTSALLQLTASSVPVNRICPSTTQCVNHVDWHIWLATKYNPSTKKTAAKKLPHAKEMTVDVVRLWRWTNPQTSAKKYNTFYTRFRPNCNKSRQSAKRGEGKQIVHRADTVAKLAKEESREVAQRQEVHGFKYNKILGLQRIISSGRNVES